jgi:transposase InsO family protein
MALTDSMKRQIKDEWEAAHKGTKSGVIARWAQTLGCSYQSLYGTLEIGRQRNGERRIEGIEDAATLIAQIKRRPPRDAGEIATDQAVDLALSNGIIPEKYSEVSIGTWNRVMRECGFGKRSVRRQRYQAEYPNQLHHVDASSSQFFYVHREAGDGDYILRMHGGNALGYKNKPVPIRLRPWLYGLTDDYSGYHLARYIAAAGESLADNLQFLAWAWSGESDGGRRTEDGKTKATGKEFFGIPERIKSDQGPLMKGDASREWLDRLGVEQDGSTPYAKEAHGKIERPWRTLWGRFERVFFVEADWRRFEITLSELNRRFRIYQENEYNMRSHRYEKNITRLDAWRRINLRGGAVAMPENAIATAARRYIRTVNVDGTFSVDGMIYEVKGLHEAKVRVYEGIFDDRLVVEDMETGEKYQTKRFTPAKLDEYHRAKDTPHQTAAKNAEDLVMRNTLYTEDRGRRTENEGKIARLPTRIRERRKIENPLGTDSFGSIEAAMREFLSICPVRMTDADREAVKGLIIENGLSRGFVRELALEVQAEGARAKEA